MRDSVHEVLAPWKVEDYLNTTDYSVDPTLKWPNWSGSVSVQLSGHATSSDSGALLLNENLDRSSVIDALGGG